MIENLYVANLVTAADNGSSLPINPVTLDTLLSVGFGAILALVIWFGQQYWGSGRNSKRIAILSFVEIRGIYRTARDALRDFDATPDGRQEYLLARHLLAFRSHKQALSSVWPGEAAFEEDLIVKVSNLFHSIGKLELMLSNIADHKATQQKNDELRQKLIEEYGQGKPALSTRAPIRTSCNWTFTKP